MPAGLSIAVRVTPGAARARIASGAHDRRKTIVVEGDGPALEAKLADWLRRQVPA